jgi:hypothetical protein
MADSIISSPSFMKRPKFLVSGSGKFKLDDSSSSFHQSSEKTQLQMFLSDILESWQYLFVMSILTIWSLFSEDIKLASTDKTADDGFEVVISMIFFLFILEILVTAVAFPTEYLKIPHGFLRIKKEETYYQFIMKHILLGSFYFWFVLVLCFASTRVS